MPMSSRWFILFNIADKNFVRMFYPPYLQKAPDISSSFIWRLYQHSAKSNNYEAVLSIFLLSKQTYPFFNTAESLPWLDKPNRSEKKI
jgi:hypothetical protein